jgi:hypothetical protein
MTITGWRLAVAAFALVALIASCSDAHEALESEIETFPAPSHLVLLQHSVNGPSRCFAGDCPRVSRYYASERKVEDTCRDVRRAVDGWDVEDAHWRPTPCSLSTTRGGDELGIAVYSAARLPPSVIADLDPAELDRYRSAVYVSLTKS